MVVEINHHWVTFKHPGSEKEFRARTASRNGKLVFEVQAKREVRKSGYMPTYRWQSILVKSAS